MPTPRRNRITMRVDALLKRSDEFYRYHAEGKPVDSEEYESVLKETFLLISEINELPGDRVSARDRILLLSLAESANTVAAIADTPRTV